MTMIVHTAAVAPTGPRIRINLWVFAKSANIFVQAQRHSREAQNLSHAPDTILKDLGLTRLTASGNTYMFARRD
jgi:hypothetical protein